MFYNIISIQIQTLSDLTPDAINYSLEVIQLSQVLCYILRVMSMSYIPYILLPVFFSGINKN